MGIVEMIKSREIHEIKAEGKAEFLTNLLTQTDFSNSKIPSLSSVSEAFVRKIRASLKKNK